jgi:hypothetical protein
MKTLALTALLAAVYPQVTSAQETKKPKSESAAKDAKAKQEALRGRTLPMDSLFNIVQIGRTQEGVHLPMAENGKVTTVVDAEKMTRVDEHNIEFEQAVINQKARDGVIVHMPRGYYNRQDDLLLSTLPAIVESTQYRIEGDALSVDRKTNTYRMDGRVRFMFFGATSLGKVAAEKDTKAQVAPQEAEKAAK